MRIAYLVNQYPKVSHSFIRREILAIERRGCQVLRIALRGWQSELVDPDDRRERERTRYVLRAGAPALLWALLRTLVAAPKNFFAALALALRMGWASERALPYHLAYLAEACRVLWWLKSFGAVHLHAHFGTNSAEVAMLAHALGAAPYSFTVHGPDEFDKPQFLGLEEKARRAAFVVAVSSYGRSQLYRWLDRTQWKKVKVVHCGLEAAFAQPGSAVGTSKRLVCVGRLCAQKGQVLLLDAVERLARKGIEFELVLAGDGEMRPEVESLIARYGLAGRVRVTGWISADQVRSQIIAARGLVLPSFAEGLPVVIMEAMALRRPVVTTCVGGVPELVRPGESGWLVPPGDVDALAAAIEELLSCPDEALRAMGETGHRRVMERHSIDVEAAKLARWFADAVQASRARFDLQVQCGLR